MTYDVVSETNSPNFSMVKEYDYGEADTLLILNCHDVGKRDPFSGYVVFYPDTDIFLLLIHHFLELTLYTLFRTGRGNQFRDTNISKCYETIGLVRATALLGFCTLTECDQTRRFNGKTKLFWWKQFYCAGEDDLAAMVELDEDIIILS